jgi:DNA repair protein SbcC/Rad50
VKLSRILFKPGWQDKDAATRLAAVSNDDDPELIAALPELTRGDDDARVRLAALRRLGDYERWRERSTADPDPEVRRIARSAYVALLCAGGPGSPDQPRVIAELDTLSDTEIETVATAATDRELRALALARVTRPALLAERAGADPDPALRLSALQRIHDPATLKRIAERTRKTDKTINRAARDRLQALRIERGDPAAIEAHARALCERIESLLRQPGPDRDAVREAIHAEWRGLGAEVPAALAMRFQGTIALLQPAPPAADVQLAAPAAEPNLPDQVPADGSAAPRGSGLEDVGPHPADPAAEVASRARFDAALAAAAAQASRESDHRAAALRSVEELVPKLAAALDAGDTGAAHDADAEIAKCLQTLQPVPHAVEQRLGPLHARLAELRRWQHWANQRRRRALCAEIEALPASGLHPDALATRVHDARTEWARLDAMEGHDHAGKGSAGIARRFFAACQHALKPAQAYFAKRDSVRDAQRHDIETLLARLAAIPSDSEDWKTLTQMRQQLAAALRSLSALNPRDRNAFARRIKDAIAALSPRLEDHGRGVEAAKARLIEQAQALAQHADRGNVRAVRELQQQWTALGNGLRSTDQKQWREFRKACDQVFAALDGERKEREARDAEQAGQARGLLAEAEALLQDAAAAASDLAVRRKELSARWRDSAPADRNLDRRFRQALDALAARIEESARSERLKRFTNALDAYALIRALEHGRETSGSGRDAELADEFSMLQERRRRSGEGTVEAAGAETLDAARDVLIRLEFLGGVPTPAEDSARRMNYQVSRLSARMRGGSAASPDRELAALLADWFALPGSVPDALDERFERAARAALATLP